MPSLDLNFFCAETFSDGNVPGAKGFFKTIELPDFPCQLPNFHFVAGVSGIHPEANAKFRVKVYEPNGNILFSSDEQTIIAESLHQLCICDIRVEGIIARNQGAYEFSVLVDGERIGSSILSVAYFAAPYRLLTNEQINALLTQTNVIKNVRIQATCNNCQWTKTYQANLDPNEPIPSDAEPFPEHSRFTCPQCGVAIDIGVGKVFAERMLGKTNPNIPPQPQQP